MMRQSRSKLTLIILALATLTLESLLFLKVLSLLRVLLLLLLNLILLVLLLLLNHLLIGVMCWAQSRCLMKLSHHLERGHVRDVVLVD